MLADQIITAIAYDLLDRLRRESKEPETQRAAWLVIGSWYDTYENENCGQTEGQWVRHGDDL